MMNQNLQAGPGTIAEAMIQGLPIILNDYIAGQVSLGLTLSCSCIFLLCRVSDVSLSNLHMELITDFYQ